MRSSVNRSMRRRKVDSEATVGLFVVLIVALVIAAILAAVVFVPWQTASVDESRHVTKAAGFERMTVSITSTTGQIEVGFGDLADDLAQFSVKGSGRLNLLTSKVAVTVNLTSSSSPDGKTLNIQGVVNMRTLGSSFQFSDLKIMMLLESSIPSHVNAISDAGQVSLTTGPGVMLSGANLQTTTGAITLTLGVGTNLTGNVTMVTTVEL